MLKKLVTASLLLCAASASAEIVLFTDGRFMKVKSHKVSEGSVELGLETGGSMRIPIERIERIIEDEVVYVEVAAAVVAAIKRGVFPSRSWHFSDDSKPMFKSKYDQTIVDAARTFDIDAALVSAVIKAESDYNPRIVSHKGAQGLMQLMPATAKRFGVADSFDPVANIFGGTRYLKWLLKKFDGDADLAVAAYNAGEGNIAKYKGVPPFRETVNYINRIARHFKVAEPEAEPKKGPTSSLIQPASATMVR